MHLLVQIISYSVPRKTSIIRAKRVSNCCMQEKKKTDRLCVCLSWCSVNLGFSVRSRPWTHTSDDSYFYQLSLVLATATVSLYYGQYVRTYQNVAVQFTILRILRNIMYYRQYEIRHVPMQWCVVRGVVMLWADDSARFPKKKKKNASSAKIRGERVECARKPWKSSCPPTKKVRKKQVGVIDSPAADDVPGVFPNLAVPVGIPKDVLSCAWYKYNVSRRIKDRRASCHIPIKTCLWETDEVDF